MQLSVIIPAYNEELYVPETLTRVTRALAVAGQPSEIVVVDNASHDRTRAISESFGARVVPEKEHNISRVRNTGAANAKGDVLIFIDADTLVPESLFQRIAGAIQDEKCFGGAVAVNWGESERTWMKLYLLGGKFWTTVFNMKQGAAQFCRRAVFEQLRGYDQTIYMGEDVEFYWRLSKFTKQNGGTLKFIEDLPVTTSARRFDKMNLWKTFLLTNPMFIPFAWRKKKWWKDWYEDAVR
ncbi:MAG TPA: glycosyltransferase [Pyrinomonadaceae bacterium]|nr:glycosyltransferase [Pyrinomonadaceae bacterium]